jgi:hypothetical protein
MYSFHYENDCFRAARIRNIGTFEKSKLASDNEWESIKRGGDAAIRKWIDGQIHGTSCCVVLIGPKTAGRKWIKYEIERSWNEGKGLLGIHVHNMMDIDGTVDYKGTNPFDQFSVDDGRSLSKIVKAYDPPCLDSKAVYNYIAENLEDWIEDAIEISDRS